MKKYTMFLEDGNISIQRADYIEDGWYIEIIKDKIMLYEIPLHGGKQIEIGNYCTILEAINAAEALT